MTSTVLGPGSINNGPLVGDDTPGYSGTIAYNHSPLDVGDTLPIPTVAAENYTWWGFPTWAETRSIYWTAATKRLNYSMFGRAVGMQAYGLSWQQGIVGRKPDLLPPQMNVLSPLSQGPWYSDGAGSPAEPAGPAAHAEPRPAERHVAGRPGRHQRPQLRREGV